jgi:hypothetical protein
MAERDPENEDRCLSCGHRPDMCECACCWGGEDDPPPQLRDSWREINLLAGMPDPGPDPEPAYVLCPYCRRHVFTQAYREHKRVHHA